MNIIKKDISKLIPAFYNPRKDLKPSDPEYQHIKNSIEKFGYIDPIIYNKRTNYIIGGHQRFKVLKELGYKEIDCVELDLDDKEEKALNVALNKISGEWDMEALELLLSDLDKELIDDLGLNFEELEGLEEELLKDEEKEIIEDEIPEIDLENVKAKRGQIYKLGRNYLMCGDSTKEEDIKELIGDNKINILITDPPYGIDIVDDKGQIGKGSNKYLKIKGDEDTETARLNYNILKDLTDNQIIFGGNYFTDFINTPSMCWIVWDKKVPEGVSFADVELAYTSFNRGAKLYSYRWSGFCKDLSNAADKDKRFHPTQKPVGLLAEIIKDFTDKEDLIIDCFGGSGSTLIAAEQLERPCFMMEYEPYYIDLIIKRWEKITGQTAELIKDIVDEDR